MVRAWRLLGVIGVVACQGATTVDERAEPVAPGALPSRAVTPRWPAARDVDRQAVELLPAAARPLVARSTVPVLAPRDPALAGAARLTVRGEFAALSARAGGVTFSVHATRREWQHPGVAPQRGPVELRGTRAFVTQNEGIWSASWIEHEIAYSADLECDAPSDTRCADSARLLELCAGLRFVGGAGVRP